MTKVGIFRIFMGTHFNSVKSNSFFISKYYETFSKQVDIG